MTLRTRLAWPLLGCLFATAWLLSGCADELQRKGSDRGAAGGDMSAMKDAPSQPGAEAAGPSGDAALAAGDAANTDSANPPVKQDSKPPVKQDYKPPVKQDFKPPVKQDYKPPVKLDSNPPVKPDSNPPVKPDSNPPAKPDSNPPAKPDSNPPAKPDTGTTKQCTNPVFTTSDPNGGWSNGGYYVHNNMWNCGSGSKYQCKETLYACAYNNFYVVANMNNNSGDGAVKTYPNVHKDYNNPKISSFKTITSTFAATSPHVGIYNVAYDIWLNGVATSGCTEVMIWTENYKQVPAGSKAATVTLGGRTYNVWKTSGNGYIAFVPTAVVTAGSIDLLELFNWIIAQKWISADSYIGQIDFGVEIVSTDSQDATFTFTDFSITSN